MRRVLVPCVLTLAIVLPPNAAFAGGHHVSWWREFGTPSYDWASDVVVIGRGTFMAGGTAGAFPGFDAPTEYGGESTAAFVRAYRSDGSLWWTREFSPSDYDWASSIAADSTGVYVGGSTVGAFPNKKDKGRNDAFVRKYSFAGDVLWTRQFGSNQDDLVSGIAVTDGRLYVVGETHGRLPGLTHFGGDYDAFVKAFTANGRRLWADEFGSDSSDGAAGVVADPSGVYVAGST